MEGGAESPSGAWLLPQALPHVEGWAAPGSGVWWSQRASPPGVSSPSPCAMVCSAQPAADTHRPQSCQGSARGARCPDAWPAEVWGVVSAV